MLPCLWKSHANAYMHTQTKISQGKYFWCTQCLCYLKSQYRVNYSYSCEMQIGQISTGSVQSIVVNNSIIFNLYFIHHNIWSFLIGRQLWSRYTKIEILNQGSKITLSSCAFNHLKTFLLFFNNSNFFLITKVQEKIGMNFYFE